MPSRTSSSTSAPCRFLSPASRSMTAARSRRQPGSPQSWSWYDQSSVRTNSPDRTAMRPASRPPYMDPAASAIPLSLSNRSRPPAAARAAAAFSPDSAIRLTRIAHAAGSALPCSSKSRSMSRLRPSLSRAPTWMRSMRLRSPDSCSMRSRRRRRGGFFIRRTRREPAPSLPSAGMGSGMCGAVRSSRWTRSPSDLHSDHMADS